MDISLTEQRQIENEMIFRRANEKVGDDLDALDAKNIEEDNPDLIRTSDLLLHFKCECSDENCDKRIPILLSEYTKIHKNRNAFILKHHHQVDEIEKVIKTAKNYIIVQKNNTTAEPTGKLNDTTVDNS